MDRRDSAASVRFSMKPALLIEGWFWGERRLNGPKLRGETGDRDRAKLGGIDLILATSS
jgi:hypothetical protein